MSKAKILSTPIAEEPPPLRVGKASPWHDVAGAVKAQPNVWLRVAEYPGDAQGSASGATSALKKRGVEAKSRTVGGVVAVFARYSPDAPAPASAPRQPKAAPAKPLDITDVAETYIQAVEDGGSGLAAIVELHGVDERAAQKLIREARRDGLLPKAAS